MTILDEIFANKRVELAETVSRFPFAQVRAMAENAPPACDFISGLSRAARKLALVAEVKYASPSKGDMGNRFQPVDLARIYQENGAAAISVLTERRYFQGSLDHLASIRASLEKAGKKIPLLRKDFLFDPYQVFEARAAGADALLLIVAGLDPVCLRDLAQLTAELGMAALIEVHNHPELETALSLAPRLVGINNRNLKDFSVHLETTLELRKDVPAGICLVAESGIHSTADVKRLEDEGIDAILVGEALITSLDVARKVRSFAG
jgi:indole-3-glycerol phosphate synthase